MKSSSQKDLLTKHLLYTDKSFDTLIYFTNITSIYEFKDDKWEKLNIEGPCSIYKTNDDVTKIAVFNRKSLNDFIYSISKNLQIDLQGDFVILKNIYDENVYGFWYDESTIAEYVYNLLKENIKIT